MKEKLEKEEKIIKTSVLFSTFTVLLELFMILTSGSKVLLVDFVFSLSDLILIIIISFLIPLLYKPVTEKRPYGYSQVESVFIIIKGITVSIITISLIYDSIKTIIAGGEVLDTSSLLIYEVFVELFCLFAYFFLKIKSKNVRTPIVVSDIVAWKVDVFTNLGMLVAFICEHILYHTRFESIVGYIDPVLAIIMSIYMIREPIKLVIESFRSLILFAPSEETLSEIKKIVNDVLKDYPYEITFCDVVKTGRKIWIEIYIKNDKNIININELKEAKSKVEAKLEKEFNEIYVEFTPEI